MNDFANPPIVKFQGLKPQLHTGPGVWPCTYCWPRLAMTAWRDEREAPCCPKCFEDPNRRLQMPWFVVRDINGELH